MTYQKFGKRIIDFTVALLSLMLLLPLFLLIALLVVSSAGMPVFFLQKRLGMHQKTFIIFKFRTMTVLKGRSERQTFLDDSELIWCGRLMRRFKIDELPQLLNILIGDMSLIGPRPCLPSLIEEMPVWAKARFQQKPGLTGLAQISGNVRLSWLERWDYDVLYVKNINLMLDLKIFFKTFSVMFFGETSFRREKK